MIEAIKNSDNTALLTLLAEQQSQLEQKDLRITNLEQQLEQLLRHIYGQRSEKFSVDASQMSLGLDLPLVEKAERKIETITYEREKSSGKSNHKGRIPFPEHLPRVDEVVAPKEDVNGLAVIGQQVTERLEFDPGKLFVKRYIRYNAERF